MLMPPAHLSPPTPSLQAEHGMSMMELLVSMLASSVVIAGLVALLVVTMNEETRITDRAQADQIGRTAMSNVVEKLHSACTGFGSPIQAPSSSSVVSPLETTGRTSLWFISVYGENKTTGEESSAAVLPKVVTKNDIVWEQQKGTTNTGKKFGTLVDYAFQGKGEPPDWSFPAELKAGNATKTIIAKDVIPPVISGNPTIFQYYKYSLGELTELTSAEMASFGEATAEDVAKVTISFEQAAPGTKTASQPEPTPDTRTGRAAAFSDAVVLRYTPTESATSESKPCE